PGLHFEEAGGVAAPRLFVAALLELPAALLRDRDAHELRRERARGGRGARAPVALGGELVLLLAPDAELARAELARFTHMVVVVRVAQAVVDEPVHVLPAPSR